MDGIRVARRNVFNYFTLPTVQREGREVGWEGMGVKVRGGKG